MGIHLEQLGTYVLAGGIGLVGLVIIAFMVFITFLYRRVVPTNEVHIVQCAKMTTSYGKDTPNGNVYYEWPSWIPKYGVDRVTLPTSVFDLDLHSYEAYDKGRLPFVVDVKAFFRITDSNTAAQRVASFSELNQHLKAIVQGSIRVILASNDIEYILQGRATFGEQFTKEVADQLSHWGVSAVKNIELMDIRDSKDSHVIMDIMAKKKSHIEMESRTEVAKNQQAAVTAEIEARKQVDLQKQEAEQSVGMRVIETKRKVEMEAQAMTQVIKEQQKITTEKEMEVTQVENIRAAEIAAEVGAIQAANTKKIALIQAEQVRDTALLQAEGERKSVEQIALGKFEADKLATEALRLKLTAEADGAKAIQLAPVAAQIALAKEIGENGSYQSYLLTVRKIEADEQIGIQQAKALEKADIKIISNTDNPTAAIKSLGDLVSSKGGIQLGAMLEGFSKNEIANKLLNKDD